MGAKTRGRQINAAVEIRHNSARFFPPNFRLPAGEPRAAAAAAEAEAAEEKKGAAAEEEEEEGDRRRENAGFERSGWQNHQAQEER